LKETLEGATIWKSWSPLHTKFCIREC